MKNIKKGVLVLTVLFMLTGCIKSNNSLSINKDKSMDLNVSLKVSNDMLGKLMPMLGVSQDMINEGIKELEEEAKKEGYSLVKTDDNDFTGVSVGKKFDNIDDMSTDKDLKVDLSKLAELEDNEDLKFFKRTKGFLKDTYKADFYLSVDTDELMGSAGGMLPGGEEAVTPTSGDDATQEAMPADVNVEGMLAQLGGTEGILNALSNMEVTFEVKLPRKNISTNLDEKYIKDDGKTLVWDFSDAVTGGNIAMQFEFDIINQTNLYILLGAAGGVLLLVIIIIIVVSSKKKKAKAIDGEPIHTEFDPSIAQNVNAAPAADTTAPVETNTLDSTASNVEQNNFVSSTPEPTTAVFDTTASVSAPVEPQMPVEAANVPEMPTFDMTAQAPATAEPAIPVVENTVTEVPVAEVPVAETPVVQTPIVEAAPVMPTVEAPVVPTETVVPTVDVPTVEVAPEVAPAVAEVPVPQATASYEFTLPEETASVDAQVEVTNENKPPMFVSTPEVVEEAPAPVVAPEISIETPAAVDMNNQNM